ncbi:dual oxidase isoform X1 [Leguminivora glycinivorella]|uniref:dual oxidase isoform X1 n=3 Tax=Leguminivora glycinivorella TaxID=1035111 RepID=UPI002010BA9A|nr:dual oxidase isoform X1 [Leguminivora glycinivorella]XP_047991382.1 dual oxidase isoform X1 [Leguminivora glycinivorella]
MSVGSQLSRRLTLLLATVLAATLCLADPEVYFEKQRYDGWYNNRAYPDWGSVDSRLIRKTPASYADGVYMMAGTDRPGARTLSKIFMRGQDGLPSVANRTALLAFFGQVVTGEIVMASESGCPIEHHRIPVDKCDHMYDPDCEGVKHMPFLRAAYDRNTGQSPNSPREQINQITSWIDGSFVYSTSEAWVNAMRSFQNGSLSSEGGMPLRNTKRVPLFNNPVPHYMRMLSPERLFLLGDPRTNQNPAMVTFGILLLRWHNVVAARVHRQHPDWSDEQLFQRARRIVIASLQNIILYEYVPAFLGVPIPPYKGYRAEVAPGVSHAFATAAFRFGHTLVPPAILLRDRNCRYSRAPGGHDAIRLCQTWWDGNDVMSQVPIEEVLMGMASQLSEREDALLCSDVRDNLFGPMEFSRRDLGALNIMRGRDNGLPDYNTAREYFGLKKVKTFNEINPELFENNPELLQRLIQVYEGRLDNIDVYIGGMLESSGHPGELFRAIIIDQFTRIRDADRFWFESDQNGIFTQDEIDELRHITLWDIIVNSTAVGPHDIQRDVFHWNAGDPCPQPYQLNASKLAPCKYLRGYDYFEGNEFAYIYTCLALVFVPILCAGAGYGVVKLQNSRRRKLKIQQEQIKNASQKGSVDKMVCREWVHASHKRLVKLRLGPEPALHVTDRKGDKLRTVPLHHTDQLTVLESQDTRNSKRPLVLIRAPREHDLVLEMDSAASRRKFLVKLDAFLAQHKKALNLNQGHREQILATAETRERRQRKLEHFFREAYAITFGLAPGEKRRKNEDADPESIVMRTSLSKSEFASALGMKADAVFVKKMFNIVDKDSDGRISFQEFLDTVVLFSRGATDDKLRIIFDMCDNDRNGVIDKGELSEMLRSLVEIARTTSLRDEHVTELIDGMFSDAGLQHKDHLTYSDFKVMMKEYKGEFVAIGLDCKGAKQNFLDTSTNVARMTSFHIEPSMEQSRHWILLKWDYLTTFLEENRQNIFYLFIFYVVTIGLFVERFAHYSFMSEHLDLRHIMGVGIAITRGSAASLSFCYSLLLLTMSRNLLTKLKEFSIQQYIPLDSSIQFHKIVACTALFFSLLHTAGHMVNFYHVSTQPVENLRCLTKEVHFTSDFRPGITYWVFQTVTGISGVLLFVIMCIIFVFAHPTIRKRAYPWFWRAHSLHVALYALCLVHGLARLTGAPRFWIFFLGPAIIYTLDKVVSLRTKYLALDVQETEMLPSDVIKIKFYRPPNLKYLSGQWVRLACTAFKKEEFHSFTLTSAPHENFLSCHIKAQGPWTWKLRNYFDPCNYNPEDHPKIRIQGPFGGGNQDWYKFEVAVMVGGGIGVTPYASILNDLVFGTSTNRYSGVACKKVYFLWICPSHKHFEWFIDVLRDVERKDVTNVLEIHIFITQFFHKFDLRTTMLYICENHFQRLSRTSMFTGLKAVNHFGRPDMSSFLKFVQKKHSYVSKIGVFSCGPRPLTKSVMSACEQVNRTRRLPYFIHHFENFG